VEPRAIDIQPGQPSICPLDVLRRNGERLDSNVQAIVNATKKQTGSCGSCHIGEAASKAGQQINLARRRRGPRLY